MPKQQITIDVPDGKEVEITSIVPVMFGQAPGLSVQVKFIDAWVWPEWLKAPWIAMDDCGEWFAFHCEPVRNEGYWTTGSSRILLTGNILDFTPPPCNDWRQSKRRRPS